jgi:hypothetical protein
VRWNGAQVGLFPTTEFVFRPAVIEIVASSNSSRLQFEGADTSDGAGDFIDDVTVVAIPVAGSAAGYRYILPHYAAGDTWRTTLLLVNPGPVEAQVEYTRYDTDGRPVDRQLNLITLPIGQSLQVRFPVPAALGVGWVLVTSNTPIVVSEVFTNAAGRSVSATALPDFEATVLPATPTTRLFAPFDHGPVPDDPATARRNFTSGIAIANPTTSQEFVTFVFRTNAGVEIARSTPFRVDPLGQFSFNATATGFFPQTAGQAGFVEVTATDASGNPAQFAAVGFRFHPSGVFTTLPF